MQALDLTGQRFERLTALESAGSSGSRGVLWKCLCQCGKETVVTTKNLRNGNTKSCGCLASEITAARNIANATHGMTKTPTWISWDSMIQRCTNPRHKSFADYGGRGIVICDDWWDFGRFLADMGERPKGTTLDRYPDLNGNYEPDNCRWATGKQQGNNRRSNVVLEFDGKKQTVAEWALELGIGPKTIGYRLRNGWTLEEALTMKVGHGNGWARGSR